MQRKRDEIKESPPALISPPVARRLFLLRPFWVGTSRHRWPPGNPSPIYRTSPRRAAQRLACVGICPLSIMLLSPPLARAFSAGLSIGCSGGRDAPASGLLSCLRHPPPAFVVYSVSEPFELRPHWRVSGLLSVETGCQNLHTDHWDGSLAPSFAFQSIAVVLTAFVGLPLSIRRRLCF